MHGVVRKIIFTVGSISKLDTGACKAHTICRSPGWLAVVIVVIDIVIAHLCKAQRVDRSVGGWRMEHWGGRSS